MPFRARVSPISLVRRQAAAARLAPSRAAHLAQASLPAARTSPFAGPGPITFAAQQLRGARDFGTSKTRTGFADFFRRGPSKPSAAQLRAAVLGALGPGKLYALIDAYDELIAAGGRLGADDLAEVLDAIAGRATGKAHTLRKRIWTDADAVHRVALTDEMYRAMVAGCAKYGDVDEALRLVDELQAAGGGLAEAQWAAIAGGAAAVVSPRERRRLIGAVIDAATRAGYNTDRTFAALLEPLFSTTRDGTDADFASIVARMKTDGVATGPWVEIQLVAAHLKASELAAARAIADTWPRPDDVPDVQLARELVRSVIALEMAADHPDGVEAAVRSLPYGSDMSGSVFLYLVQHRLAGLQATSDARLDPEQLLRVVDDISRSTGREPSAAAWARLVSNVLATSDLETAFVVYQAARKRAPFTTADLARDLITKLCDPAPPHFAEAMQVYDDLAATPAWEANRGKDADAARAVYATLLRACDRAQPPAPGVAMELADSAKERGVRLPAQDVTHYIVDCMAVARDHPEAHDVYTHLLPLVDEPLNHRQYTHILTKFIVLDFPGSNVAPPDYVLGMLADMRRAGHEPNAAIITSLLKSYASLSKKVTRNRHKLSAAEGEFAVDALTSATHDVYRLVSLDPMLEVDVPLLVALMDALSSVNAFPDAMEVWNEIVRRRGEAAATLPAAEMRAQFGTAVSVALDTCGFADLGPRAVRIWAWGRRHQLIARRTWAAYIECLCRLGRYDDALDVLTVEMERDGLVPTLAETSIPAKFAWRQPRVIPHVMGRLERGFPEYAEQLRKIVATKSKPA